MVRAIIDPPAPERRLVAAPIAAPERRLRVAFMGRSLRGQYSGVVRYTDELVRALTPRLGADLHVFLTRADDGLDDLPIRRRRAPFATPNEYARAFWEQCVVPFDVRRVNPDVYYSPNYILPAAIRCPSVVTVHDVAFLDRSVHQLRSHLYLSALTMLALRKASRVVCVSAFTGDQLARRFPWVQAKVRVVGEGVSGRFRPQPPDTVRAFRERHSLTAPYFLFVGTVEPRKNLPRLIRAFEAAESQHRLPHDLVIAGASGWKTGAVREAYERSRLRERVRFIGYVDEAELPAAYSGADAFVYPSLHEGFGLPPLEAMACGTPVVTSNTSALAGTAGPAALTVDPENEAQLAAAMALAVCDRMRHADLTAAGLAHAAAFRWDEIAAQMLDVFREAAS